jgi:hypothetical protein
MTNYTRLASILQALRTVDVVWISDTHLEGPGGAAAGNCSDHEQTIPGELAVDEPDLSRA